MRFCFLLTNINPNNLSCIILVIVSNSISLTLQIEGLILLHISLVKIIILLSGDSDTTVEKNS